MALERPPTIDPAAALRWQRAAPVLSPWLHEEVGRRMEDRLQWIRRSPEAWADWEPVRGGLKAHALVAQRYPRAACQVVEPAEARLAAARQALQRPWWRPGGPALRFGPPAPGSVQLVWANMLLHMTADPAALLAEWHAALAVDGFVMFSCLGPDTLAELRALYATLGWPPPAHGFTDMHDWGDMLAAVGFAEPVMDMERITLTFATPGRALAELRELGANLHRQRFTGLRGRRWRAALEAEMDAHLKATAGQIAFTFEIIYGHAFKPAPRAAVREHSTVALDDMRRMLQSGGAARR